MSGLLFITANNADARVVNRLLLHIRDWESGEEDEWDRFVIVRNKNISACHAGPEDSPPLDYFARNQWTGASVREIEECLFACNAQRIYQDLNTALILDDQGVREKTIIVALAVLDPTRQTRYSSYLDRYNKIRVPWRDAQNVWWSLEDGGDPIEDWCQEKGVSDSTEGGWFTYRSPFSDDKQVDNVERDDIIRELEKLSLA